MGGALINVSLPLPIIRFLVPCRDVEVVPGKRKLNLMDVITAVRPVEGDQYPILLEKLTIFCQLLEIRSACRLRFQVIFNGEQLVFETQERSLAMPVSPLTAETLVFRMLNLPIDRAGMYEFDLYCNDEFLGQATLRAL